MIITDILNKLAKKKRIFVQKTKFCNTSFTCSGVDGVAAVVIVVVFVWRNHLFLSRLLTWLAGCKKNDSAKNLLSPTRCSPNQQTQLNGTRSKVLCRRLKSLSSKGNRISDVRDLRFNRYQKKVLRRNNYDFVNRRDSDAVAFLSG